MIDRKKLLTMALTQTIKELNQLNEVTVEVLIQELNSIGLRVMYHITQCINCKSQFVSSNEFDDYCRTCVERIVTDAEKQMKQMKSQAEAEVVKATCPMCDCSLPTAEPHEPYCSVECSNNADQAFDDLEYNKLTEGWILYE